MIVELKFKDGLPNVSLNLPTVAAFAFVVLNSMMIDAEEWRPEPRVTADPISARFLHPWANDFATPEASGLPCEVVRIPGPNATNLRGWYFPQDHKSPVVIVCMGNTGNISVMLPYAALLHGQGLSCLLFDYQGYGGSEGTASCLNLVPDVRAAFDYVVTTGKATETDIGLLGISLGTVPAIAVAAEKNPGAVAVEDAFRPDQMLESYLRFQPASGFLEQMAINAVRAILPTVDPMVQASRLNCPALLLHGVNDRLLPPAGSIQIASAITAPKTVWLMEATGHAPESLEIHDREYADQIGRFFRQAFEKSLVPSTATLTDVKSIPDRRFVVTVRIQAAGDDSSEQKQIPVEVVVSNGERRFQFERCFAVCGEPQTLTFETAFRPSVAFAVPIQHARTTGDETWVPDLSERSRQLAEFRDAVQEVFHGMPYADQLMNDRGDSFYAAGRWLPNLETSRVQQIVQRCNIEALPVDIRSRWGKLLARIQCWPDKQCDSTAEERCRLFGERVRRLCPENPRMCYEAGNASFLCSFADSAVGDALYRLARQRLQEDRPDEARQLLRQHVQILPAHVQTSLTEDRIESIQTVRDLDGG
ncbi:MAG: alpha/beta hydrolase [Planctomycetaceae bacterium]